MRDRKWIVTGFGALAAGAFLAACGGGEDLPECSDVPGSSCDWAGQPVQPPGRSDDGVDRREARLWWPADVSFGPDGLAYLVDWNNHRVLQVDGDQNVMTVIGTEKEGDGPPGETDRLPLGDPEGAVGTTVALNHPTDIDFMPDGTLVLAAWHNNKVRLEDPDGIVTVLTGDSYGFDGDGEQAYMGVCNQPKSVVVDGDGGVYFIDQRNERVRYITSGETPMIDTVAGDGTRGFAGDGGDAMAAEFAWDNAITPMPSGALALSSDGGTLYVADTLNNRIRAIDLESGTIATIAGNGTYGYSGDGGPALDASFYEPTDIELGPDGKLYVADTWNNVIRAIDLQSGIVNRVAGNVQPCPNPQRCYQEDEGLDALDIQLSWPYGIGFDAAGVLYIADTYNNRIVRIAP